MELRNQLMTTTLRSPFFYYTSAPDISPEAEKYLREADTYFPKNDIQKITECYKKALEKNPESSYLLSNIGTLLAIQGAVSEGIKLLRKAIERNNACVAAHHNLGAILLSHGVLEAALEHLQKAQELEPKEANAQKTTTHELEPRKAAICNNLGLVYLHLNQLDKAEECFEKALKENPNSEFAANNLGCIAYDKNNFDKALSWFSKAQTINPHNVSTMNNMACTLFLKGETSQAIDLLYSCMDLNPQNRVAYFNLGFMVYNKKLIPTEQSSTEQSATEQSSTEQVKTEQSQKQ